MDKAVTDGMAINDSGWTSIKAAVGIIDIGSRVVVEQRVGMQ